MWDEPLRALAAQKVRVDMSYATPESSGYAFGTGLPFLALGWLILGLTHLWFAARTILGVIYLARDEPYPRPRSWLL